MMVERELAGTGKKQAEGGCTRCWSAPWLNSVHAGIAGDVVSGDRDGQRVLMLRTGQQLRRFRVWAAA